MKFLSTTLAVLALATPAVLAQSPAQETAAAWAEKTGIIQDPGVYFDHAKNMIVRKRRQPGITVLIPRNEEEAAKGDAHRKERALQINAERRHLQGAAVDKPDTTPTDKGTLKFFSSERPLEFQFSGLGGASEAKLIFTKEGEGDLDPVDLAEFMTDGVADVEIELHNHDATLEYSFQVVYTVDGVEQTLDGGSFRYGPSSRTRSGNIQTNSKEASTYKTEGPYEDGGQVLGATGRIYFSSYGVDYACTGTVIRDNKSGRSLVLTAAHCVFDDIDWVFGSDVIFIPNRDSVDQTDITGADIHRQCSRDICGCWSLSGGVVHDMWADTPWPERLLYDYGFYVVDDVGDHQGTSCGSDALDEAIEELDFTVGVDIGGDNIHGFGYSLEHNPDFRECADDVEYNQPIAGTDTYWLPGCGLKGGSSGGPWLANFDNGVGDIVSVNSWSYSDIDGMGGPIIDASAARCLVNAARDVDFESLMEEDDGDEGVFVNCYDRPCIPGDESTGRMLRGTEEGQVSRHRVLCGYKE